MKAIIIELLKAVEVCARNAAEIEDVDSRTLTAFADAMKDYREIFTGVIARNEEKR